MSYTTVMIRTARMSDIPAISELISQHAGKGLMLFRSLAELYEHLRDFIVAERDGRVVGCCALNIVWSDLAEVKSLAVEEARRGQGLGQELMTAALAEAARLGLARVFALTYQEKFFAKFGFVVVPKETLPHKVWGDCVKCPKQNCCDEIAMVRTITVADLTLPGPVPAYLVEDLRPEVAKA